MTALPAWVQTLAQILPLYWLGLGMRSERPLLSAHQGKPYKSYKQDYSPQTSGLQRDLLKSLPEHRGYWLAA